MKIVVLNGSPKGKYSITLQSIRYIGKHFPSFQIEVHNVGHRIKSITSDSAVFDEIIQSVDGADLVLFCYPVYTFLVPFQLVQFISMVFEKGKQGAFAGKYASQLSTSKHFFDHTAYNYIQAICEDIGMKHLKGFCADSDDLTFPEGRSAILSFARELQESVQAEATVARKYPAVIYSKRKYKIPATVRNVPKTGNKYVVLITDLTKSDVNLDRMIQTFTRALPNKITVVNIGEFPFRGGCLGCINCVFEAKCVYTDGFDDLHRNNILTADCVIFAATVDRHWFRPVWKCYDDRQFYNGHRTSFMHKCMGYIISGPLAQEPNLREILEGRADVGQNYLLDIVTDEPKSDREIADNLKELARRTVWALEEKPLRPRNFYGVGGMKIFRDLIYIMKGIMQEDHRFYKKHGMYDFPHKKRWLILKMQFIGLMMKKKSIRKKSLVAMQKSVLDTYDRLIEKY